MNKKEAAQILAILKAAYPNSYKNMTQEEAMGTVSVWALQFADMPSGIVLMAVHKAISSSPFPPSISEVKDKMSALYWEAYDMLDDRQCYKMLAPLPEKTKEQAKMIYEATSKYKYPKCTEPTLHDMLPGIGNMNLLGSPDK